MRIRNRSKKGDVSRLLVLQTIHNYAQEHGRSASYRELIEITGLKSSATIARHVATLQGLEYLQKQKHGEPRSLVITDQGLKALENGKL